MGKKLRWRLLVILLVVLGAVGGYVLIGYQHAQKEWTGPGGPTFKDALKKGIKLGLDLRGGIHLVLQVKTADAVKAERDDAVETLQERDEGREPRPRRAADRHDLHRRGDREDGPGEGRGRRQAVPARLDLQHRRRHAGRSP